MLTLPSASSPFHWGRVSLQLDLVRERLNAARGEKSIKKEKRKNPGVSVTTQVKTHVDQPLRRHPL